MISYRNARSVAAVCAMLAACFLGSAQASDPLPKAAAPVGLASLATGSRTDALASAADRSRARDQETVISAEHAKVEAVPEPTGLLLSCLLGGVLLAIGQRLRFLRSGAA